MDGGCVDTVNCRRGGGRTATGNMDQIWWEDPDLAEASNGDAQLNEGCFVTLFQVQRYGEVGFEP